MKHRWQPVASPKGTLLLLHGTGGDETSLLPVARDVTDEWNVLSVRGNVDEAGALRFFRRLREGVLDEDDLIERTDAFYDTLVEWSTQYDFSLRDVVLLGYSNGANFAANVLLQYPNALRGGILFHPMVPTRRHEAIPLDATDIFLSAGTRDPLVPFAEANELAERFDDQGARVQFHIEAGDHRLTYSEVGAAKRWLADL